MTLRDDLAAAVAPRIAEWEALLGRTLPVLRSQSAWAAVAARLDGEPDPSVADALIAVLWDDSPPPAEWWRSSLGLACARHLAGEDLGSISHGEAAAMLGVTRGTVAKLVHRGTLARHPRGGVSLAAVLARLVRMR